jgi:hypothetical protein
LRSFERDIGAPRTNGDDAQGSGLGEVRAPTQVGAALVHEDALVRLSAFLRMM